MFRYPYCGWSRRYAYAGRTPTSRTSDCEDAAEATANFRSRWSAYESRAHGGRQRGGSFGTRRPLRYLSYHLDLDEEQQRQVATVLDQLKTEQAQAQLDEKKTTSAIASLIGGEQVAVDELRLALAPRVDSARQLQSAIATALQQLAATFDADQRQEFAYLLRTGAFRL